MRVRNIDTDLLRTFVTLVDLGGFTRAGEALGRSQPAISLQMKRLEEAIGAPLLRRDARDLGLTIEGETLLGYARRILRLNDEALAAVGPATGGAVVRLGIPNDFAALLLPRVLAQFAEENADVRVSLVCELSHVLLDQLAQGALDVVVAMHREPVAPPAAMLRAWTERLVWVGTGDTQVPDRAPVPLVAYPEGCAYRMAMLKALNLAERPWRLALDSPSLAAIEGAVRAGLGITVMAERTVPPGLAALPPSSGLPGLADAVVGLHFDPARLSVAGRRMVAALMEHANRTLATDEAEPNEAGVPIRGKRPI
jgi:DNA-binding transcriptional LysR family regulator